MIPPNIPEWTGTLPSPHTEAGRAEYVDTHVSITVTCYCNKYLMLPTDKETKLIPQSGRDTTLRPLVGSRKQPSLLRHKRGRAWGHTSLFPGHAHSNPHPLSRPHICVVTVGIKPLLHMSTFMIQRMRQS